MKKKNLLSLALGLALASFSTAADRPNIIFFLADDLGYGDLGCYGSDTIKSPNIDAFAEEGMKFTQAYSAGAVCSPSRAGIITGRTPFRSGIYGWLPGGGPAHLQASELTIATLLRNAGYSTCHVGKWHLNSHFNSPKQPQPNDHGFDWWFATQNNAMPSHHNPENFVRNGEALGTLEGYSALLTVDEAIAWLRSGRSQDKPFYLQVWTHEPHLPLASAPQFLDQYADIARRDELQALRQSNITQMDFAFGELMKALDELDLADKSLVVFTSDNGPVPAHKKKNIPAGSTGGLRGHKSTVYEGGIRVPAIVRWPGRVPPGSVCDVPINGTDFFSTFCAVAGVDIPTDRAIDGTSLVPLFTNEEIQRDKPLYWRHGMGPPMKLALRDGDWKVLSDPEFKTFELYNLAKDPKESKNLADSDPGQLDKMVAQLRAIDAEVLEESKGLWPDFRIGRPSGKGEDN